MRWICGDFRGSSEAFPIIKMRICSAVAQSGGRLIVLFARDTTAAMHNAIILSPDYLP
jgi:hypothetical protein